MLSLDHPYTSWTVALGIGLLIGVERERRKGEGLRVSVDCARAGVGSARVIFIALSSVFNESGAWRR